MNTFAQIDASIVTAILQANTMPTLLPLGRTFVDITTLPDKNILGWTHTGGITFTPPVEGAAYASDITRIVAKLGA